MTAVAPWLPNFFIAGVPKAGTSSLHRWLAAHPDAFGSTEKETCYFADPTSHLFRPDANITNELAGYEAFFPVPEDAHPRVIFESTPAYIYQRAALDQIPNLHTRPKCLFVLREPAEQIHSLFTYFQNNWNYIPAEMTFEDFLAAIREGSASFSGNELAENALSNARYAVHLRPWRERLGPDRFRVVTFDELRRDPRGLMTRLAMWLDLDSAFYDSFRFEVENESYVPRSRLLQRLNIALRASLPKGATYNILRRAYRLLNTTKTARTPDTRDNLAALRAEFLEHNAQLARDFDLDLSEWSG
ncbi:sulfotransferase [Aestuariicoccus sp. MJ-SS9]|uniref:sulfotransferase family protein n=1 Tax=Aestuariicoccus sp. MJ-SS9 TaxID=3079855 RepID=UPI002912FC88|nr:sulfotransferase [Aestuariicoccus sp. MJ-SS9]MDU8911001.1 sulfotransferase [Aestuariicoccus sp. MJ-SS9]